MRLLEPFVRKGLIEGVCVSGIWNVPPREALQEKMGVSFETKDCLHCLRFTLSLIMGADDNKIFPGCAYRSRYRLVKVSIGLES